MDFLFFVLKNVEPTGLLGWVRFPCFRGRLSDLTQPPLLREHDASVGCRFSLPYDLTACCISTGKTDVFCCYHSRAEEQNEWSVMSTAPYAFIAVGTK
jgi:hypothetical protein